jgi:ABC-type nitrate/sulfonate/bicarbonate transport system substrate-binding protein
MRRQLSLALCIGLVLLMALQACAPAPAAEDGKEVKQIHVAYDSSVDIGKIPSLLALEKMRDYGYDVSPKFYPDSVTAIQAVLTGDCDLGMGDTVAVILANEAGQSFRIFALEEGNQFALVSPVSITDPSQLTGKKVAYHSPASMTRGLAYLAAETYGFEPEWLVMEGSEVRAEALLSGEIDATVIDYEQTVNIQLEAPGEYHVLVSFADEFPGLMGNGLFARAEDLEADPDLYDAMVEALLLTFRRVNSEPDYLFDEVPKFLPGAEQEPDRLREMIQYYIDYNVWDGNGFTKEAAADTEELYVEVGDLEDTVPFEEWATLGPLERVLEKIGRA